MPLNVRKSDTVKSVKTHLGFNFYICVNIYILQKFYYYYCNSTIHVSHEFRFLTFIILYLYSKFKILFSEGHKFISLWLLSVNPL